MTFSVRGEVEVLGRLRQAKIGSECQKIGAIADGARLVVSALRHVIKITNLGFGPYVRMSSFSLFYLHLLAVVTLITCRDRWTVLSYRLIQQTLTGNEGHPVTLRRLFR